VKTESTREKSAIRRRNLRGEAKTHVGVGGKKPFSKRQVVRESLMERNLGCFVF